MIQIEYRNRNANAQDKQAHLLSQLFATDSFDNSMPVFKFRTPCSFNCLRAGVNVSVCHIFWRGNWVIDINGNGNGYDSMKYENWNDTSYRVYQTLYEESIASQCNVHTHLIFYIYLHSALPHERNKCTIWFMKSISCCKV